jgi:hypothetical protein
MKHEWKAICDMTDISQLYVLESFFYIHKCWETVELIPQFKDFLLDSGAYSLMVGQATRKRKIEFSQYVKDYATFIRDYKIKDFIELDVDHVLGPKVYEYNLKLLQDITGRDPIMVMHRHRGKEWLDKALQEHDRICIGGLAKDKGLRKKVQPYIRWVVDQTHKAGKKIHGLGFSDTTLIRKIPFDSGDSTAWTTGIRFGVFPYFDGHDIKMKKDVPVRIKRMETLLYSVNQWVNYSKYVDNI